MEKVGYFNKRYLTAFVLLASLSAVTYAQEADKKIRLSTVKTIGILKPDTTIVEADIKDKQTELKNYADIMSGAINKPNDVYHFRIPVTCFSLSSGVSCFNAECLRR